MVELDEQKQNFIVENETTDSSEILREERKRTGRYVAAGTAIFLSALGLFEALSQETPEFAAVFLTAIIMFGYILWLLYASKARNKKNLEDACADNLENVVISEMNTNEYETNVEETPPIPKSTNVSTTRPPFFLARSYSVA